MEMIDERLLEGSTDTIPKLDALEEHAAVMNVDHATLGNSQGSSVPWLDTLSLLPNGTGTADSPHMGRSNLSSEPTATMNSDSNNSTPCPSPQISGQNPNISYVATQDALRMSMRQHRKSMTLKHTAPSHLSKREIYALAMAPSAITSDSLPSPIAEEVPTFSQPGAPSTTQGQAQDMHISETLQASQPGQNPSVQGALEAAPRQQSIATAAQTMAAVAQTAASIAQTTNPLPRSSTTFGRSNASQ